MAHNLEYQRAAYPLMAYNFLVIIGGAAASFTEVSGLEYTHETLTYRHGFSFTEGEEIVKYRVDRYVDMRMRKGTTRSSSAIYAWLSAPAPIPMEVALCDEAGKPFVRWAIAKALPVKLEAGPFAADSMEVAIDTLLVKAAGVTLVAI